MTEAAARAEEPMVMLRFAQPADLLDIARDCLLLAAEGYEAMGESALPASVLDLVATYPLTPRDVPPGP